MPLRNRFLSVAALAAASALAVGCTTEKNHAGGLPVFSWVHQADVPESRNDLKDPTRLDLSYAQWQEQLGNLPEAQESYKRVLKADPQSVDALLGVARLEQLAGRNESAEQAYLAAAKALPGNPQVLDAVGQFYSANQRWSDAAAALAAATKAAPQDPVYRHHYAVALARAGETGQALAEFTRAVGEAEAHYNVGYVLYEQGRTDLAEREFLQAVALRPDLESAQAMLDEIRRGGDESGLLAGHSGPRQPAVRQTAAFASGPNQRAVVPAGASQNSQARVWQLPVQESTTSIQAEQLRNQLGTIGYQQAARP
jgi:tetratricopeptide (TPR) repeat protein